MKVPAQSWRYAAGNERRFVVIAAVAILPLLVAGWYLGTIGMMAGEQPSGSVGARSTTSATSVVPGGSGLPDRTHGSSRARDRIPAPSPTSGSIPAATMPTTPNRSPPGNGSAPSIIALAHQEWADVVDRVGYENVSATAANRRYPMQGKVAERRPSSSRGVRSRGHASVSPLAMAPSSELSWLVNVDQEIVISSSARR
ncbi:MAG: hypothetical protein U5Q44_15755 [Dehalococcoidia bacterium]|nr:hypothetical protein [Dehalococcoidia bacterium]